MAESDGSRRMTHRWLVNAQDLSRVLALECIAGESKRQRYLNDVGNHLRVESAYYCAGRDIEQALTRSGEQIARSSCKSRSCVVELRGPAGSGCSLLSIFGGRLLLESSGEPLDGVMWPKVLYISMRAKPRGDSPGGVQSLQEPNIPKILDGAALYWTGNTFKDLLSSSKLWMYKAFDEDLVLVIDDAELLCTHWKQAADQLLPWVEARINVILINQSDDYLQPLPPSYDAAFERAVVRLGTLTEPQIREALETTRTKRNPDVAPLSLSFAASANASLHTQQLKDSSYSSYRIPPRSSSLDDGRISPPQPHDFFGKSVMEEMTHIFRGVVEDESMLPEAVIRWVQLRTGGVPKKVQEVCDSLIEIFHTASITTAQEPYSPRGDSRGHTSLALLHDTATDILSGGGKLIDTMRACVANMCAASQIFHYSTPNQLLADAIIKPDSSTQTTTPPSSTSSSKTNGSRHYFYRSSKSRTGLSSPTTPSSSSEASSKFNQFKSKLYGLQGAEEPRSARKQAKAVAGSLASVISPFALGVLLQGYDMRSPRSAIRDALLMKQVLLVDRISPDRDAMRRNHELPIGIVAGPETLNCSSHLRSFAPFMRYTYHGGLNAIARSYIRFCPDDRDQKLDITWHAIINYLLSAQHYPLKKYIYMALVMGIHSWSPLPLWRLLIPVVFKYVKRMEDPADCVKKLAVYCGFQVKADRSKKQLADNNSPWRRIDDPFDPTSQYAFSKNCRAISASQFNEILHYSISAVQKGIVTMILESFVGLLYVIEPHPQRQTVITVYSTSESAAKSSKTLDIIYTKDYRGLAIDVKNWHSPVDVDRAERP